MSMNRPQELKLTILRYHENSPIIILAEKGSDWSLETLSPQEKKFLKNINDAGKANPDNPMASLGSTIDLELLTDFKPLASARVQQTHRVIMILRYMPDLNKLVMVLIKDDPNHQYRLEGILNSYKSRGYS